jgi:hypothetical protein
MGQLRLRRRKAGLPHKTRFHELAHIMLSHTAEARGCDGHH